MMSLKPAVNSEVTGEELSRITPIDVTPPAKEKLVTIRTKRYHKCTIGGVTYAFEKGIEYKVPEHIKMILQKQDILRA